MRMPPTAVMPEMALVTDIRGEWRAGTTPQTVWKPKITFQHINSLEQEQQHYI